MGAQDASRVLSLLALDGGPAGRDVLRATLGDLVFVEAQEVSVAVDALSSVDYDCALLDLRSSGPDALGILRAARDQGASTPIVVLTARTDEALAVELLHSGAVDCIMPSSFSAERLRLGIDHGVRLRRLERAAARERQRLVRLQRFTAALATRLTVVGVAESTTTELRRAFNAPRAIFAMVGSDGNSIDIIHTDGFPDVVMLPWRQIPLQASLPFADAMRLGVPLFFEDSAALMSHYPHLRDGRVEGDEALSVVPLVVEGRALGIVALIYSEPHKVTDDDRDELLAWAGACGQALDRAYLFDVAQFERRRAEEANRAKDDFLATVSHELRTPLNAILGWAKMLAAGSLSSDQTRKAISTIERNAVAQARLIDDLLDVSRIIAGQMRIKWEPVDLAPVLDAALDIVRPAADAKGVRLHQDFDLELGPILGDPDRLQQVFWNLLSNAVKFTPRGGRVVVRLFREDSLCVVEVEDTGKGIPRDFLPQVFQRFRQHDASTARATTGLGVGLAIVRHLVELHGGAVVAASPGSENGSTLTVRLPINARLDRAPSEHPPVSERTVADSIPASVAMSDVSLRGLTVLVVDDDVDGREVIASALLAREALVVTAANAREAMEALEASRPDVVVSDIGMPGEDGYALMERVRALPIERGGRTPAIALTAYARYADRAKALLAGFTAYASKPITPNELILLIATASGRAVR